MFQYWRKKTHLSEIGIFQNHFLPNRLIAEHHSLAQSTFELVYQTQIICSCTIGRKKKKKKKDKWGKKNCIQSSYSKKKKKKKKKKIVGTKFMNTWNLCVNAMTIMG